MVQSVALTQFDRKFGGEVYETLPLSPGVYLFKDGEGGVIYVGKAKNLRRRLGAYRNAGRKKTARKMRLLVRKAKALEIRPVATEREALLLENQLIQTLRPKYNVSAAYFFLYPSIGFWKNGRQTILCLTTDIEAWAPHPIRWFGSFRSRMRAVEAFDAMVALLSHLGHVDPRSKLPSLPRLRGSRAVGLRQLDPAVRSELERFWAGEHPKAVGSLARRLLEKPSACRDAAETQEQLRILRAFERDTISKLRKALLAKGAPSGQHVPQRSHDELLLELACADGA